jgi:hypothetical protein
LEECFDYDDHRPASWLRREPFQRFGAHGLDGGRSRYLPTEWSPVLHGTTLLNNPVKRHSAGQQEGSFGIRIRAESDNLHILYLN